MMLHKDVESVLLSQEKLEKIVKSLAKQIEKDYNDKEFMMVGLLKGSVAFMADLMKRVNLDFSID
ncbi:MAG: hypoxanthine phosphoribosyltransferase, partial [Ruminococcus sp.]|nr:hypoxanthine phosphoribosyltransferase [Ruminococcus sp.]